MVKFYQESAQVVFNRVKTGKMKPFSSLMFFCCACFFTPHINFYYQRCRIIIIWFFFFIPYLCAGQIKGFVGNYSKQPLYLYRCYGDTLLLVDSTVTDAKGKFAFPATAPATATGLYKVVLQRNQWFYILLPSPSIEVQTLYSPSPFYNIATDSLVVLKSEENKKFYEFQFLQKQIVIADNWLLQMMRLYPLPDPFHKNIEEEYLKRYEAMENFVTKNLQDFQNLESLTMLIAKAYYVPFNPDWQQPDPWRDSIIASHYFDYFNPADSFYLHTNILPEKMDHYLALRTNKRDDYGQPVNNPNLLIQAAKDFLEKTKTPNSELRTPNFLFCLSYLLKIADKEHKDDFFLALYDEYLQTQQGDCGTDTPQWAWAREKANILRGVQTGNTAPDFVLQEGMLNLSSIQSDYTLLLFWASWCSHCTQEIPEIKKITDSISAKLHSSGKRLTVIAISLDTDKAAWQKYVLDNNLFTWLNTSELKGWKGEVPKQYNVYATPTMFLLDKDKKIIAKPMNVQELEKLLMNDDE